MSQHKFFGPVKPIDESHYIWKVLIALTTLLVAGVVVGFLYSVKLPEQLSEISMVIGTANNFTSGTNSASGAGDVIVAPPRPEPPQLPEQLAELPDPDSFSADAMIVKDTASGAVLYRKNEYAPHPIASLTKLMSALTILERNPEWEKVVEVSPDEIVDTHMYAGDTYTMDELWRAALVGSSNKAILTLSDAVGWPREAFIERMNQKAREYGMQNTKFAEPTGINDVNVSTASDIVLLLEEALKHERIAVTLLTKELSLYSVERSKEHHIWNTNWLLLGWIPNSFADFKGGKTGYIPEAGYNFIMQVADESGHTIDVVVLGTESHEARFTEARDIGEWVFANYVWPS